ALFFAPQVAVAAKGLFGKIGRTVQVVERRVVKRRLERFARCRIEAGEASTGRLVRLTMNDRVSGKHCHHASIIFRGFAKDSPQRNNAFLRITADGGTMSGREFDPYDSKNV